ncbi:MAG TPA: hypothetical protein ENI73_09095 [Spirochaetes bacterium]|nr:hypothetical protein [Spirochaetota bacterium]
MNIRQIGGFQTFLLPGSFIALALNLLMVLAYVNVRKNVILLEQPVKQDKKTPYTLDRWYRGTARTIVQHYVFVLLFCLHITILLGWLASGLKLKADLISLLPDDFPSVRGLKEVQEVFGGIGYLMLVIETDEAEDDRLDTDKKINIEYVTLGNGRIKRHPRLNKSGIVDGTEKVVKRYYYTPVEAGKEISENGHQKGDGQNGFGHKSEEENDTKVRWEADLFKTKTFVELLVKGKKDGLKALKEQIEHQIEGLEANGSDRSRLVRLKDRLCTLEELEHDKGFKDLKGLESLSDIAYCDFKKPIGFLKDNAVLFSDIEDLALIFARARKKKREVFSDKIGLAMNLEDPKEAKGIDISDIEKKYENRDAKNDFISQEGYYLSKNNKVFVILIKPSKGSLDIEYCKDIYRQVHQEIELTKSVLKKKNLLHSSLKVGYAGRYKRKPESTALVEKDLELVRLMGFLFIVGLVTLYFRRLHALLLIGLPLGMGIIWTYGITFLHFGYVNILTGFLSVILMGLGIDFGIHFLSRYHEERRKGESIENALYLMLSKTGRASLTAVLTTIAAFLALVFTDFKGFNEFGFIGMIGLMMAYLSIFYGLPGLLVLSEKMKIHVLKKIYEWLEGKSVHITGILMIIGFVNTYLIYDYLNGHPLKSVFSIPISYLIIPYLLILKGIIYLINRIEERKIKTNFLPILFKNPRVMMGIVLVVVVISLIGSSQVYFDYNFRKLEGMNLNAHFIEDKTSDLFNLSLTPSVVIANNREEERAIYKAFTKIKERQGKNTTIDFVDAFTAYIPENQSEKLELVNSLKQLIGEFKNRAEEEENKDDAEAQKTSQQLNDWEKKYLDNVDYIYPEGVPKEISRQFSNGSNKKDTRYFVQIFPTPGLGKDGNKIKAYASEVRGIEIWETLSNYSKRTKVKENETHKLIQAGKLESKKDSTGHILIRREVSAAGENLVLADILELVEREAPYILATVFILTILLLLADFRTLKGMLITFLPLVLGIGVMVGSMALFDVQFNILNVVILPVIIGIGIDNGVHLYHRYQDEGKGSLFSVLRTTGIAVTFASLTDALGFGSLMFAGHKGLNSLGSLAVLGIGATYLIPMILIPATLLIIEKAKRTHTL